MQFEANIIGKFGAAAAMLALPIFPAFAEVCPPPNDPWPPCRSSPAKLGIAVRDATIIVTGSPTLPVYHLRACLLDQSSHTVDVNAAAMVFSKEGHMIGSGGQGIGLMSPASHAKPKTDPGTYTFSVDFSGPPVEIHDLSATVTVTTNESNCTWDRTGAQCTHSQPVNVCWYDTDYGHPFTP